MNASAISPKVAEGQDESDESFTVLTFVLSPKNEDAASSRIDEALLLELLPQPVSITAKRSIAEEIAGAVFSFIFFPPF